MDQHTLTRDDKNCIRRVRVGDAIRFDLDRSTGGRYRWKVDRSFGEWASVPGLGTGWSGFTFAEGDASAEVDRCVLECGVAGRFALSVHYEAGTDRTNTESGYDFRLYLDVAP